MEATMQLQPLRVGGVLDGKACCASAVQLAHSSIDSRHCGIGRTYSNLGRKIRGTTREWIQAAVLLFTHDNWLRDTSVRFAGGLQQWLKGLCSVCNAGSNDDLAMAEREESRRAFCATEGVISHSFSRGGTPDEQEGSCKSGSYDAEPVLAGSGLKRRSRVHNKEIQSVSSDKAEVLVQERNFRRHHDTTVGHTPGSERFRVCSRADLLLQWKDAETKRCSSVPVRVDADDYSMATTHLLLLFQQWGIEVVSLAKGDGDRSYTVVVGGGPHA